MTSGRSVIAGWVAAAGGLSTTVAVGMGGAVGAVLRWWVTTPLNEVYVGFCPPAANCRAIDPLFPLGTLVVNVLGALLLGILAGRQVGPRLRAFIGTGVLGAFTTYSAFAVEVARLAERSAILRARDPWAPPPELDQALAYVAATIVLGLLAARAGLRLGARRLGTRSRPHQGPAR